MVGCNTVKQCSDIEWCGINLLPFMVVMRICLHFATGYILSCTQYCMYMDTAMSYVLGLKLG